MDSIRSSGLLQPIIVRIVGQRFEVVAGNRRLEACRKLRWIRIPCLVKELADKEAYEIGLVENLERKTLTPVEEALAFQRYVQDKGWGGVTELGKAIGRSKEYVSHRMSLLELPRDVLDLITTDKISPSSAHELIWMKNPSGQKMLAKAIIGQSLSTTKVRQAVKMFRDGLDLENVVHSLSTKMDRKSYKEAKVEISGALKKRKHLRLLDKSILTLRICMVRMDSIIEEIESESGSDNLKNLLIQKRLLIHNQIDEFIHLKRYYSSD
jgi:ParB family transcriptional regulator, chromosome partitioning protein